MKQGKLKIFFGYCAGVGKTYAMLEAAHERRREGMDVVIGYIEKHDRLDTIALMQGLLCGRPEPWPSGFGGNGMCNDYRRKRDDGKSGTRI